MKKLISIITLLLFSVVGFSQDPYTYRNADFPVLVPDTTIGRLQMLDVNSKQKRGLDKYISAGVGYNMYTITYSVEGGLYWDKIWLGLGYDYTPHFDEHYGSFKLYYKVTTENKISLYSYNAFKMRFNDSKLFFEPGFAIVFDLGPVAPQFTATVPFSEDWQAGMYYGIGLNVWIPGKVK